MLNEIIDEIKAEREYQTQKWDNTIDDTKNTPWMWASYIGQYATKWMVGTFSPLKHDVVDDFRTCMVKVATLAVAAIESIDRQRAAEGRAFFEDEG